MRKTVIVSTVALARIVQNAQNDSKSGFFSVEFKRRSGKNAGKIRSMLCHPSYKLGERATGGQWANGKAGTPESHGLIVTTDVVAAKRAAKNKTGDKGFRSFGKEAITQCKLGGVTYVAE